MVYNNNRKQTLADRGLSSKKAVAARLDACIGDGHALVVILRPSPLLY